jgi:hypothetical protein
MIPPQPFGISMDFVQLLDMLVHVDKTLGTLISQ